MVKIPLKHGKVLLIDEIDIPLINHYKWYARNEKREGRDCWNVAANVTFPNGKRTSVRLHHLILHPAPTQEVDHKDHNVFNNTRENLRLCSRGQNNWNQRRRIDNQSGFKGLTRRVRSGRITWEVYIQINKKRQFFGTYLDPVEAAKAYDTAARQLFGEFACLNFPDGG